MTEQVSVIIAGVNKWQEYTCPFIDSLQYFAPDAHIVCVDSGSKPAYPDVPGVQTIHLPKTIGYAANLNIGLKAAPPSKWYVVANNDILVRKNFVARLGELDEAKLYGFIQYHHPAGIQADYMPGWWFFVSQFMLATVGLFDEAFVPMYFEDADYCIRLEKCGFQQAVLDREEWGVHHLEDERMIERKNYMYTYHGFRDANRKYLKEKHGLV